MLFSTVVIHLKLWKKKERELTKEKKQRQSTSLQNIWYNELHYVSNCNWYYWRPGINGEKAGSQHKKKKSKEKEEKRKGGSNKGRKTKLQQVISNNHNNQRGFWKEEILDDKRVLVGKNESVLNNC